MKKVLALLLAAVMTLSLAGMASASEAEVAQDIQEYLWEISDDMPEEEYITLMTRNFRIIQAFELLFTEESYKEYSNVYSRQFKRTQSLEDAKAVVAAQDVLVQKASIADGAYFLWGDSTGPVVDGEEYTEEELDASNIDGYGQRPVLIKALLDDPTQAKGNIIMISGGGFNTRSNPAEGYAAIPVFQELGYNCFLLQRRVAPYSQMDIFMDLQRAIRLIRYYAAQEGWGGQDMIAAAGFSGGGGTIMGTVFNCYGDLTPVDVGATAYEPDEIDAVNSDLDVAMPIYGAISSFIQEGNENLPAFYIAQGLEDDMVDPANAQETYDYVSQYVPAELFMIPGAKHGFGPGTASNTAEDCKLWPGQADAFMQQNLGHSGNTEK